MLIQFDPCLTPEGKPNHHPLQNVSVGSAKVGPWPTSPSWEPPKVTVVEGCQWRQHQKGTHVKQWRKQTAQAETHGEGLAISMPWLQAWILKWLWHDPTGRTSQTSMVWVSLTGAFNVGLLDGLLGVAGKMTLLVMKWISPENSLR